MQMSVDREQKLKAINISDSSTFPSFIVKTPQNFVLSHIFEAKSKDSKKSLYLYQQTGTEIMIVVTHIKQLIIKEHFKVNSRFCRRADPNWVI